MGLGTGQKTVRILSKDPPGLSLQFLFVCRRNLIDEFVPGISRHHGDIHAFSRSIQHQRIPHAETSVQNGEHAGMGSGVGIVTVPDQARIQRPGLFQSLYAQKVKKRLPVFLRFR